MQYSIAPTNTKHEGRCFQATLLGRIDAPNLWEKGDAQHPAMASFAGSEQQLRSFVANLQTGRPAQNVEGNYSSKHANIEFARSDKFRVVTSKLPGGGAVSTLFHRELFSLDPGLIDPKMIRFICAPPLPWIQGQVFDFERARQMFAALTGCYLYELDITDEKLQVLLAEGLLLLSHLDKRCTYPIPGDPIFGAWLAMCCQGRCLFYHEEHIASKYRARVGSLGLHTGFAFQTSQSYFGDLLSENVKLWFKVSGGL